MLCVAGAAVGYAICLDQGEQHNGYGGGGDCLIDVCQDIPDCGTYIGLCAVAPPGTRSVPQLQTFGVSSAQVDSAIAKLALRFSPSELKAASITAKTLLGAQ